MKFRAHLRQKEELKLNMTAMIDIVFQLLVFFILTFKVTAMETDFNISMPLAGQASDPTDVIPQLIQVKLRANSNRDIAAIEVDNEREFKTFDEGNIFGQLTDFVERTLQGEGDPSTAAETEVEFVIDPSLRYRYTVMGIEAVSGRRTSSGQVKTLVEKIKFRKPPAS
jgi:biopolymer transport protein ExbD